MQGYLSLQFNISELSRGKVYVHYRWNLSKPAPSYSVLACESHRVLFQITTRKTDQRQELVQKAHATPQHGIAKLKRIPALWAPMAMVALDQSQTRANYNRIEAHGCCPDRLAELPKHGVLPTLSLCLPPAHHGTCHEHHTRSAGHQYARHSKGCSRNILTAPPLSLQRPGWRRLLRCGLAMEAQWLEQPHSDGRRRHDRSSGQRRLPNCPTLSGAL